MPGVGDVLTVQGRPWYVHHAFVVEGVLILNGWWDDVASMGADAKSERCWRRADTLERWDG